MKKLSMRLLRLLLWPLAVKGLTRREQTIYSLSKPSTKRGKVFDSPTVPIAGRIVKMGRRRLTAARNLRVCALN